MVPLEQLVEKQLFVQHLRLSNYCPASQDVRTEEC